MATGDELRRRKAQLELEEQIVEAIKNSTSSLENFAEAQKKINENFKLMKKINLEIAAIESDMVGKSDEEKKILKAQLDSLRQQQQVLIGVNRELSKGKNFAKAVGNEFINWGKELRSKFIPSITEAFNKFLTLNDLAIQTAASIGLSGQNFKTVVNNIEAGQGAMADYGFELEDSAKLQQIIADETGRQVILSSQVYEQTAKTARGLNMSVEELGGLVGQMDQFGMGSTLALSTITDMRMDMEKMGVNSGKVIKKFQENLGLMNKLNFKSGVKGMMEMAKFSEKYKIDMNSVAAVADKVFRPEGAIEAAAQLQVLGGSLAALGDPFQLMYKARNTPEELAKNLTAAASASATFDKTTKEWKVNAYELDRLKEAANALGMDYQELVKTAKQTAKINVFEGLLSGKGLDKDQISMLSGLMEMSDKGATINGKLVSEMNPNEFKALTKQAQEFKELSDQAMSSQKELTAIQNKLMLAVVEIFKGVDFKSLFQTIKGFIDIIHNGIKWLKDTFSPTGLLATTLGLYFGGKALVWFLHGKMLGAGFNSVVSAGSDKKGLIGKIKGLFGKKGSISTPEIPTTGSNAFGPTSQRAPTVPSGPGGITKGFNATDMIKGAAAIVILSAAMFVFAKSLQEFDKVNNKGQTILMAAAGLAVLGTAAYLLGKVEKDMIKGALAIGVLSIAMIPLAFALNMMKDVGLTSILVLAGGLLVLGIAAEALGATSPLIFMGALAIAALGLAVIPLAYAFTLVADGISTIVSSFTEMFSVIGPNGTSLLMAGLGFMAMAAGIGILTLALVGLGLASILALPGLMIMGSAVEMITGAAKAMESSGGSEGLVKSINAINSVDEGKLEALKDLSMWLALIGGTTTIKFDEALHIDGSIQLAGQAGGKSDTDWIKDPIFVSKLKQMISQSESADRNGGKGR